MKIKNLKLKIRAAERGFIKITKKGLIMGLAVWIILISSGLIYMFKFSKRVEAAWYDEGWSYSTSYSNNNTGSAVSNQKIKLDIDTARRSFPICLV